MIPFIDRYVDSTTMYRLVLTYLIVLLVAAVVLAPLGLVPFDAASIVFGTVLTLVACQATNLIFSRVFGVPANLESAYITALIIALLMPPATTSDPAGMAAIAFASVWAISSKFMVAIGGRHIFNPAALGVALTALLVDHPATWWGAGNVALLPLVLVGGLVLVRKLQRLDLVAVFVAANLIAIGATTPLPDVPFALSEALLHSPLLFLGFVMLTEPLTAPQARWPRLAYAALVGALTAPNLHFGGFAFTPELALLAGNLFAYAVSPKGHFALTLLRVEQAASGAYDFIFSSNRPLRFRPGQFLEWTLPVRHPDDRGNRRYFTLASAPGEEEVRLGVKFGEKASAFKRSLAQMRPGDEIHAGQLAGDFVLPSNAGTKLAFVAGGIGITPFRSMLEDLRRRGDKRDIVVLYGNNGLDDIAYGDVLQAAADELGTRIVHAVASDERAAGVYNGFIDADLIAAEVPDYAERTFYISGPHAMVDAIRHALRQLGVSRRRIKVDFFPGLA